jgi:hypothetical protein
MLSVLIEKNNLMNNKIVIRSKKLTESFLQSIELNGFTLGKYVLIQGDEIKLVLKDSKIIHATVIGASKLKNLIILLTKNDEILELEIKNIKLLKIKSRYGRWI